MFKQFWMQISFTPSHGVMFLWINDASTWSVYGILFLISYDMQGNVPYNSNDGLDVHSVMLDIAY